MRSVKERDWRLSLIPAAQLAGTASTWASKEQRIGADLDEFNCVNTTTLLVENPNRQN